MRLVVVQVHHYSTYSYFSGISRTSRQLGRPYMLGFCTLSLIVNFVSKNPRILNIEVPKNLSVLLLTSEV